MYIGSVRLRKGGGNSAKANTKAVFVGNVSGTQGVITVTSPACDMHAAWLMRMLKLSCENCMLVRN